jgi:hypothetical protein
MPCLSGVDVVCEHDATAGFLPYSLLCLSSTYLILSSLLTCTYLLLDMPLSCKESK